MIEVSVIVPCYNGAQYLDDCIGSVLGQTFRDWEMLIVDDCSVDHSREIIESYARKDPRIKYLTTECASGSPATPRNIGIKYSKGRYLAFLDCDDMWLPNKLDEQIKMIQDKKCALVFSDYEKVSYKGEQSHRIVSAPPAVDLKGLYYGNPIGCLTVLVDTQITGKFYFKQMPHEDCIAWIELIGQFGTAYNTQSVLARYRETIGSVSRNKFKILSWQWNIYRKIFKFNVFKSVFCYMLYAYNGYKKSRI